MSMKVIQVITQDEDLAKEGKALKLPLGHVTVWYMTEEQRQAYIKKHPIRQTKREKPGTFERDVRDWNWRPEKANPAIRKARMKNGGSSNL
jgi:hypothetical protein